MSHYASPDFWACYHALSPDVRDLADKCFSLLKADPRHRSLRLKRIGDLWSFRVGLHYRALAKERAEGLNWFWIGHHDEYDVLLK